MKKEIYETITNIATIIFIVIFVIRTTVIRTTCVSYTKSNVQMATAGRRRTHNSGWPKKLLEWKELKKFLRLYLNLKFFKSLLFEPCYLWIGGTALLIVDLFVSLLIVYRVQYTEIDWQAYMSEVEGVVNGTWDYTLLKGGTGPLVYPAGFVYIFMALYYLTDLGMNVLRAQYIFVAIYMINIFVVFCIYSKTKKVPPYVLIFMCCTSYRIHSIFMLRLFNDPVAMLLLYVSVYLFVRNKWSWGCIVFSLAVSVKMNILLFAPALLLLLLVSFGMMGTIFKLSLCAAVQVVLAAPFLVVNPVGYLSRAFNLGRVFFFEWTVNWRFLPEHVFLSKYFHISLLIVHACIILAFFWFKWKRYLRIVSMDDIFFKRMQLNSNQIVLTLFMVNFVGISVGRSLHYQFYVWYYHTLPYLLWTTNMSTVSRLLIMGIIELSWNTYPSTIWSSAALHVCHVCILVGLWRSDEFIRVETKSEKLKS